MRIRKISFFFLGAILNQIVAYGQNCVNPPEDCGKQSDCASIDLSTEVGQNCTTNTQYIARDVVHLTPGFHYTTQQGKFFHARIDKSLVLPAEYTSPFTQTDFDNRQINTNLPVGKIEGAADVSPSGAATYTIPIYIPPGTAGMQPNISIAYNSQGGNGLLGWGWNLGGISMITRAPRTIYNDNITGSLNLDYDDRFFLDGNRLIATSENYGEDGTTYHTETETFSQITSLGTTGNGPEKFLVQTKDGMTLEYGYTADSRFLDEGSITIIFWRLNKMYDNLGNYIEYKYINQSQESRIDEIFYTGNINNGEQPYNKIKFIYDLRDDKNTIYTAGSAINNNIILRKIEIICEGKKIKTYEFKYNFEVYSYLNEIIEFGNDGTPLNSTILKYGDAGTFSYPPISVPVNGGQGAEYWVIDYNGDGKSDLVQLVWDIIGCINCDKAWTGWNLFRNDGNNTFTKIFDTPQDFPESFQPFDDFYPLNKGLTGNMMTTNSDFNGDGFEDLIFTTVNNDGLFDFHTHQFDGTTFAAQSPFNIDGTTTVKYLDFDGDQRMDIFTHNINNNIFSVNVRLNGNYVQPVNLPVSSDYDFSSSFPIDIDGDGRTELTNIENTNTNTRHILKYNTSNELVFESQSTFEGFSINIPKFFGDFNGDGKTDIFYSSFFQNPNDPPFEWWIGFNTGNNTFIKKEYAQFSRPIQSEDPPFDRDISHFIIDANGDGKSDIIEIIGGSTINVFISNGNINGDIFTKYPNTISGWGLDIMNDKIDFGDFDGDGDMEMFVNGGIGNLGNINIIDLGFASTSRLVHEIKDGFNFKTTFEYSPLTQGGDFYIKGTSSLQEYPISDFQGALFAVSSVTVPDGIGETRQTDYKYEGAKIHKQGKGFLSFSKITTIDNTAGIKSEVNSSQIPGISPIVAHSVSSAKTIATSDNSIISENTITNSAKTYGDNRFFPFASQTVSINNLKGQTITSNFTYNNDGNLTNSSVNIGTAETESATYTYIQKGSWIPNRIETQSITKTRAGDDYTISNLYDYDSNGKLTEQTVFNGLAKEVNTQYVYNNIGNLISTTVSSPGLTSRTTTINEYDDKGRFATKITNPLGQVSEAQYDSKWGTPLMQKGIDGLITTHEYDAFGKLIKTKSPDNIETNYSVDWARGTTVPGINGVLLNGLVYSSSVQRLGSPSATTWYDIYSRAIKTQADGFAEPVNAVKLYNAKGQLETVSAPFYDGDVPEIKTYSYETSGVKTGLLESVSSSLDGIITYDYTNPSSGLFKTEVINPAGQTSSQTSDASGKVISADDDNGTILNYTYYGHGQLKEVTMEGQDQPLASMQYDEYARQSKLTDKNAGVINYTYNAYGELVHQDDYNGAYNFEYDILGRMTARRKVSNPNPPETSWEYWGNGAGINQVKSITDVGAGISQNFTYDALGRPTEIREVIGGDNYTTFYQYDEFSNVSKITYPSGFFIEKEYDETNGYLKKVKNPTLANPVFEAVDMNAFGQYTQYMQNNILTEKTYNAFGMLEHSMAGNFFHFQNDWNVNTGNLETRTNHISDNTESFTYDNLNRLTFSQTINGNGTQQDGIITSYFPNGNIQFKSRIGTYSYDGDKLNAVDHVPNTSGDISGFIQDITYTTFNKCSTITENNKVLTLTYGPDQQRRKSILTDNGAEIKTIIYSGNYEKITIKDPNDILPDKTYEVHYISCGAGLVGIAVKEDGGTPKFFNIYSDHLGSIVKITNSHNNVIYEQNFDAWGRERNPTDWSYSDNTNNKPEWLIRGFTGHEHLGEFALINMNGRVYDPLLGRFNSPDNYVQNPFGTQGYNRYSYAGNNPLIYTDPSGELFGADDILAAAFGGTFNVIANLNNIDNFGQGAAYFGIGAVGGWVGLYTFGAGGGALTALGNGLMQGQNANTIGRNMVIGAVAAGVGYGIGVGFGSSASGFDNIGSNIGRYAAKAGYSFGVGFASGFTGSLVGQGVAFLAGWQKGIDFKSAAMSGLTAGGTSAAISIGFSAYDYATWDRYDPTQKADIVSQKFGDKINYMDKAEFEAYKANLKPGEMPFEYNELNGFTDPETGMYLTDKGLTSMNKAQITAWHEYSHHADFKAGIRYNSSNVNSYEGNAYLFESISYDKTTPSRYFSPRSGAQPGYSNYFFNIFR